jgi:hypothetical protein
LNSARRRALAAFAIAAVWIWWHARAGGFYFIVGMEGEASANLGPILPAFCAGLSAAPALLIANATAGAIAGVLAAMVLVLLPGFLSLHLESLVGPPLLALTLFMLAVMINAPRFSLAYGTLAATAAAFVSPQAIGLPVGAAVWAFVQRAQPTSMRRRAGLALLPLVAAVVLLRFNADRWLGGSALGWRGELDRVFRAAGTIIGNQLVPGVTHATVRFFGIADLALLAIAVVVVAWRRVARAVPDTALLRRLYPAAGVLALFYAIGLAIRTLLVRGAPVPDLVSVIPLAAVSVVVIMTSVVTLWPMWPRWGKALAFVMIAGWLQAAIRA